jgi:hypothetical protein
MMARWLAALEKPSDRRFLVGVVGAALLVRVAWVLLVDPRPISDFAFYYDHARTIASGGGYATGGVPTAIWPIGYPAVLGGVFWLTGASTLVAGLANSMLSAVTLVFVYRFAQRVTLVRSVPRVACLLVAAWPSQIAYCALVSDSVLFELLLWAGAALLVHPARDLKRSTIAGLVFGAATLVRPYALLVPLVLLARRGDWLAWLRRAALVYAALFAVVLPWTLRNRAVLGTPVLVSTNGGVNLYIGHNPHATGGYDDVPELDQSRDELARDAFARDAALDYIRAHPLSDLALVPRKLVQLYADDSDGLRWIIKGNREVTAGYSHVELAGMLAFDGYYYAIALAALAYILVRRRAAIDGRALRLILYFTAIAAAFFGSPRFHFPIVPAIALYAAGFVAARARPSA